MIWLSSNRLWIETVNMIFMRKRRKARRIPCLPVFIRDLYKKRISTVHIKSETGINGIELQIGQNRAAVLKQLQHAAFIELLERLDVDRHPILSQFPEQLPGTLALSEARDELLAIPYGDVNGMGVLLDEAEHI